MKQDKNIPDYTSMAYKPIALALTKRVFPDLFANKLYGQDKAVEQELFDKEISDKLEALGLGEENE